MATSRTQCNRLWIAVVCFALAGVTRDLGAQQPIAPLQEMSSAALSLRDSIVATARAQVGRRYVFGGDTPAHGFDCSGLVQYVLEAFRIDVPRTSREQSLVGLTVARDTAALLPGDLLMFGRANDGISHVGIYVGHGRYVHASSVAGRVIESPLDRPPSELIKVLMDARRLLVFGAEPVAWSRGTIATGAPPAASAAILAIAAQRARE